MWVRIAESMVVLVCGLACLAALSLLVYLGMAAPLPPFAYFIALPVLGVVVLIAFLLLGRRLWASLQDDSQLPDRIFEQELWR